MKTLRVFDPPMCCSTGVCGPSVDPELARFAADLDWLAGQGVVVERHNLAQEPQAFVEEALVKNALERHGDECLPIVLRDGEIVSQSARPSREQLAEWAGVSVPTGTRQAKSGAKPGGCC